MLYMRTGTANSSLGYFSSFRVYNGSGVIDSGIAYDYSQWMGEESLADDYPLALVAPDEDEQSLVFTSPTPMKRGNAMKLRTKDFGGDYNYSKPFYITDQDQIDVGPSGTDQYIGMRLVFDFNMAATDEIEYDQIEFTYEVI
jgi:hypothetical protein